MRVLIGTPIHISKDYCMERWLQNVAALLKVQPADLLMVDNSPGLNYVEKVKGYCEKYGITDFKIEHLELPQEQNKFERVARSREIIRQKILSHNYDAWFSWECDQLIPVDALGKLIRMMKAGDFVMVHHNQLTRENPALPNYDFGVSLIKRECLEKYGFILEFGTDPDMPKTWEPAEKWFKERVVRGGDGFIEVAGVIDPIYHLQE